MVPVAVAVLPEVGDNMSNKQVGTRNHRRFVKSHLCHKSLMSQSMDDMSQNNCVTNRPSTKQNCDKSST